MAIVERIIEALVEPITSISNSVGKISNDVRARTVNESSKDSLQIYRKLSKDYLELYELKNDESKPNSIKLKRLDLLEDCYNMAMNSSLIRNSIYLEKFEKLGLNIKYLRKTLERREESKKYTKANYQERISNLQQ